MKWLEKIKADRKMGEIRCGYDYAAGEMLRGQSVEHLRDEASCCFVQGRWPFDVGMINAIDAAITSGWVVDG